MKAKSLTHLSAAREGSTYHLQIEDEAGKRALFELTAQQALRLADSLDSLLADEEQEMGLTPPAGLEEEDIWVTQAKAQDTAQVVSTKPKNISSPTPSDESPAHHSPPARQDALPSG